MPNYFWKRDGDDLTQPYASGVEGKGKETPPVSLKDIVNRNLGRPGPDEELGEWRNPGPDEELGEWNPIGRNPVPDEELGEWNPIGRNPVPDEELPGWPMGGKLSKLTRGVKDWLVEQGSRKVPPGYDIDPGRYPGDPRNDHLRGDRPYPWDEFGRGKRPERPRRPKPGSVEEWLEGRWRDQPERRRGRAPPGRRAERRS